VCSIFILGDKEFFNQLLHSLVKQSIVHVTRDYGRKKMYEKKTTFNHFSQLDGATYNSHVEISCGGVGRNIAEGIYKMYGASFLISAVGSDLNGRFLQSSFPPGSCILTTDKYATGNFAVILSSNGDCKLIAGDMNVHREISPDLVSASLLQVTLF
jgi:sugar/nucleoside kinase (ribokinase family)